MRSCSWIAHEHLWTVHCTLYALHCIFTTFSSMMFMTDICSRTLTSWTVLCIRNNKQKGNSRTIDSPGTWDKWSGQLTPSRVTCPSGGGRGVVSAEGRPGRLHQLLLGQHRPLCRPGHDRRRPHHHVCRSRRAGVSVRRDGWMGASLIPQTSGG